MAKAKIRAHLLGSGSILNEALKAQAILEERYGVAADVWSVTSYKELYRDAIECERWNLLHPGEQPRTPYLTETLAGEQGAFVAASDYMKALPSSISPWIPGRYSVLGTDGYGLSESREDMRADSHPPAATEKIAAHPERASTPRRMRRQRTA